MLLQNRLFLRVIGNGTPQAGFSQRRTGLLSVSIRQTMDTYSHVLPNMQQQAAERMDAMLG